MNAIALVDIEGLRRQTNTLDAERSAEEFWTAQIAGRPNYKDLFTVTPEGAGRSVVRLFPGWLKGDATLQRNMLLLVNIDALCNDFLTYLSDKNDSLRGLVESDDQECVAEIRTFLALKCLEGKRTEELLGRIAFFSNFARTSMARREFFKENRGFMHEAFNAVLKALRTNPARLEGIRDGYGDIEDLFYRIITEKLESLVYRFPAVECPQLDSGKHILKTTA